MNLPNCSSSGAIVESQKRSEVLLANEMVRQGVRKAELARRLDVHMPQVDRLVDLRHSSKLENLEKAFQTLGKTLGIRVV